MLFPYVWTFTTGVTPDTTNPTVIMNTPINGAIGRPVNASILGAFNEPMDPLTITPVGVFTLNDGSMMSRAR